MGFAAGDSTMRGCGFYLYNVNFNETFTDAERDRTFEAARELGAEGFSSSQRLEKVTANRNS